MTTDRATRKLAVILHADVMGSTALVQRDETLEDDIRPEVRIGIAIGEVAIADGTLTGSPGSTS
jgi:class 3 adenylate cyclase